MTLQIRDARAKELALDLAGRRNCARRHEVPLLFRGTDFSRRDIAVA
jgi:hypothetical protein